MLTASATNDTPAMYALRQMAADGTLRARRSPLFASKVEEPVARFRDVAHLIENGHGMWFGGRMPHSWVIRIATLSNVSHGGMFRKDPLTHHIKIVDVIEGVGGRDVSAAAEIEKYPGQYYWAPVDRKHFPEFDGDEAIASALKLVGSPYGRIAVLYEAMWHAPIAREIAYLIGHSRIDKAWENQPPYCSMAQSMWATDGGVDPVPGLAPQLTAPANTYQSLLWSPDKIALVHDFN